MPFSSASSHRSYPPGRNPRLKAWRYPGVPIPMRLRMKYEVKA